MITGIPPYSNALPVECSVRCVCGLRYLVFTGAVIIGDAESRERARAVGMRATFVDARAIPFMSCECGELLDFTPGEACEVVM